MQSHRLDSSDFDENYRFQPLAPAWREKRQAFLNQARLAKKSSRNADVVIQILALEQVVNVEECPSEAVTEECMSESATISESTTPAEAAVAIPSVAHTFSVSRSDVVVLGEPETPLCEAEAEPPTEAAHASAAVLLSFSPPRHKKKPLKRN
jgi:hypothetical protein